MNPEKPLLSLPGYDILGVISTSKFGKTWLAKGNGSELPLIIKEVSPTEDAIDLRAKLNLILHPVLITSSIEINDKGRSYVARPFLEGTTLKEIIASSKIRKSISPKFIAECFVHLSNGLDLLHAQGFLHGDIKPSNLLVAHPPGIKPIDWKPENIRLIDFETSMRFPTVENSRRPFAMGYSAPEQLLNHGHLACPATDIFALGITLFETLTGKQPFAYHDPELLLHLQLNVPVSPSSKLTPGMFKLILKATNKIPFRLPPAMLTSKEVETILKDGIKGRYSSAGEFSAELMQVMNSL